MDPDSGWCSVATEKVLNMYWDKECVKIRVSGGNTTTSQHMLLGLENYDDDDYEVTYESCDTSEQILGASKC